MFFGCFCYCFGYRHCDVPRCRLCFLIVVALDVDAFVVENVILTTILIVIGFVVFVPVDVVLTIPYCHDDYFSL